MLLLFVSVFALQAVKSSEYDTEKVDRTLNKLSIVNGCSDDFTRVDVTKFRNDFENADKIVNDNILPGIYAMVVTLALNFFVMALFAFGFCGKKQNYNQF